MAEEEHLDRSAIIRRLLADAVEEKRKAKALRLYEKKKVTVGKAAEIAKISIWEMLDLIKEKGLHIDYSTTELEEDLKPFRRKLGVSTNGK